MFSRRHFLGIMNISIILKTVITFTFTFPQISEVTLLLFVYNFAVLQLMTIPSPFAALLRRSKFVSYDPSIGQVYTTHGGHAHRGNWGFKRPLPNRRPTGFITVRSVDSPEQQTEWNSAENSARWMRRWEELGKKLEPMALGLWPSKSEPWRIDTEFDRAGKEGLELGRDLEKEAAFMNARTAIPNPDAMTKKQFQKYLDHLRSLRPQFKEFLKEQKHPAQDPKVRSEQSTLKLTGSGEVNMFLSAQHTPETPITDFLKHWATHDFYSSESTRIEQYPHKFAGLEYTYMSALQSQYLHKPAPGRDIGQSRASRFNGQNKLSKYDLIAVGGIIGAMRDGNHTIVPTDFGTREDPRTNREQGKGLFRMSRVFLQNAPVTVGRLPQTVGHTELNEIEFRTIQSAMANRSNPYTLGSAEYVAQEGMTKGKGRHPVPGKIAGMTRYVRERPSPRERTPNLALLSTLTGMIVKPKNSTT